MCVSSFGSCADHVDDEVSDDLIAAAPTRRRSKPQHPAHQRLGDAMRTLPSFVSSSSALGAAVTHYAVMRPSCALHNGGAGQAMRDGAVGDADGGSGGGADTAVGKVLGIEGQGLGNVRWIMRAPIVDFASSWPASAATRDAGAEAALRDDAAGPEAALRTQVQARTSVGAVADAAGADVQQSAKAAAHAAAAAVGSAVIGSGGGGTAAEAARDVDADELASYDAGDAESSIPSFEAADALRHGVLHINVPNIASSAQSSVAPHSRAQPVYPMSRGMPSAMRREGAAAGNGSGSAVGARAGQKQSGRQLNAHAPGSPSAMRREASPEHARRASRPNATESSRTEQHKPHVRGKPSAMWRATHAASVHDQLLNVRTPVHDTHSLQQEVRGVAATASTVQQAQPALGAAELAGRLVTMDEGDESALPALPLLMQTETASARSVAGAAERAAPASASSDGDGGSAMPLQRVPHGSDTVHSTIALDTATITQALEPQAEGLLASWYSLDDDGSFVMLPSSERHADNGSSGSNGARACSSAGRDTLSHAHGTAHPILDAPAHSPAARYQASLPCCDANVAVHPHAPGCCSAGSFAAQSHAAEAPAADFPASDARSNGGAAGASDCAAARPSTHPTHDTEQSYDTDSAPHSRLRQGDNGAQLDTKSAADKGQASLTAAGLLSAGGTPSARAQASADAASNGGGASQLGDQVKVSVSGGDGAEQGAQQVNIAGPEAHALQNGGSAEAHCITSQSLASGGSSETARVGAASAGGSGADGSAAAASAGSSGGGAVERNRNRVQLRVQQLNEQLPHWLRFWQRGPLGRLLRRTPKAHDAGNLQAHAPEVCRSCVPEHIICQSQVATLRFRTERARNTSIDS